MHIYVEQGQPLHHWVQRLMVGFLQFVPMRQQEQRRMVYQAAIV